MANKQKVKKEGCKGKKRNLILLSCQHGRLVMRTIGKDKSTQNTAQRVKRERETSLLPMSNATAASRVQLLDGNNLKANKQQKGEVFKS